MLKVLAYVAAGLALLAANVWYIQTVRDAFFGRSLPSNLAPLRVLGRASNTGADGNGLAHMVTARLRRLSLDLQRPAAAALPIEPGPSVTTDLPTVQLIPVTSYGVVEPVDLKMNVGGVEVGGILSWLYQRSQDDGVVSVTVHYHGDRATIAAALDSSPGGIIYHRTSASDEQVVEELALLLAHYQIGQRMPEVKALTSGEFFTLVNVLTRTSELNEALELGSRPSREDYAKLLTDVKRLSARVPTWQALQNLAAHLAENAGDDQAALAFYAKRVEQMTADTPSAPELPGLRVKVQSIRERVAQQQRTATMAADTSEGPGPRWRALWGWTDAAREATPRIAIAGGLPNAATLRRLQGRVEILGGDGPLPDSDFADYIGTMVSAVELIAPRARFVFTRLNGDMRGGADLARSLMLFAETATPADIVVSPYKVPLDASVTRAIEALLRKEILRTAKPLVPGGVPLINLAAALGQTPPSPSE